MIDIKGKNEYAWYTIRLIYGNQVLHKGGDPVKIKKVAKKMATTCKCKGSC